MTDREKSGCGHTPTPWHLGDDGNVAAADGRTIAMMLDGTDADADFILRAVNSRDDLYAALEETIEFLRDTTVPFPPALHDKITNALHRAKGGDDGKE